MVRRPGNRRRRRRKEQVMNMFSLCQQMVTLFVLMFSVMLMLSCFTQGRMVPSQAALSQVAREEDEARVMRSRIGSRPPRCAGRCYSCGHCEAIQVPTNPQVAKVGSGRAGAEVLRTTSGVYFRSDYGSNYKPMSWKCKCGNTIFNP